MRISDWSSDVCSSDLRDHRAEHLFARDPVVRVGEHDRRRKPETTTVGRRPAERDTTAVEVGRDLVPVRGGDERSEEHTSELQSLMRISYAVFCLKKKTQKPRNKTTHTHTPLSKPTHTNED